MTELIVALDGPNPLALMHKLQNCTTVQWFKLGPQAMMSTNWHALTHARGAKIFLDLKLVDTQRTVRESIKRFADSGIAAVSVASYEAMEAADDAAKDTDLRVWRLVCLTDATDVSLINIKLIAWDATHAADGIIIPPWYLSEIIDSRETLHLQGDIVCPAVRISTIGKDGHANHVTPEFCVKEGVTHAVVGRPIYQADDPVAVAREYMKQLNPYTCESPGSVAIRRF